MNIETGVVLLFNLRKHGFEVKFSPAGNIQLSPSGRLPEYLRDAIRNNKDAIIAALEGEIVLGVEAAERIAQMTITLVANKQAPWAIATGIENEWVFICAFKRKKRRWRCRWTIRIPVESFDPFRLSEALLREDLGVPVVKNQWGALFAVDSHSKIPKDPLPIQDGSLR